MKVLIIKTSSLGDIIQTLPALTDAGKMIPNIQFDWVVEENFAEIPAWHPLVNKVIPFALRRWRKNLIKALLSNEVRKFWRDLRSTKYDIIIDAQGLIKSGIITKCAHGVRVGLDKKSLTEQLARFAYKKTITVDLQKHAVFRMRAIFAQALGYALPKTAPNYNINIPKQKNTYNKEKYLVFIHGTTWKNKEWPDKYWVELAEFAKNADYKILLPWHNVQEQKRVNKLAKQCDAIEVLPKLNLTKLAFIIKNARAVVTVDTGLGHLAAALNVPTISLYGPTNPDRIGTIGKKAEHMHADFECLFCDKPTCRYKKHAKIKPACFEKLTPKMVWNKLKKLIG